LKDKTAKEILSLLKSSLKNNNNQTLRGECIDEIKRRGAKQILKDLGWPDNKEGIYKNRYTGSEETLEEMYNSRCGPDADFDVWLEETVPFIMENWLPKDEWVVDECFDEYLPKNKLTGWVK